MGSRGARIQEPGGARRGARLPAAAGRARAPAFRIFERADRELEAFLAPGVIETGTGIYQVFKGSIQRPFHSLLARRTRS
jgi:hypothetical protein